MFLAFHFLLQRHLVFSVFKCIHDDLQVTMGIVMENVTNFPPDRGGSVVFQSGDNADVFS